MDKRLAGAIAAVLGLTACSGGSTASSFAAGAPASTSTAPAPVPSSSPAAVAGLRSFAFPSDIQVTFGTTLPASEPQRSAMIAYENYVDSMWYAVYTLGKNKSYKSYISGNALTFAKQIIAEFKAGHYALRGTVRYTDMSVPSAYNGSGAVVEACVDVSGLHMVDRGTGQSAGNILNSKYTNSQEQAAAGKKRDGSWWIVHTDFNSAASGGTAGMCGA